MVQESYRQKPDYPDVLADRYASYEAVALFSPYAKVVHRRQLWVAVMSGQQELGLAIPLEAIAAYRANIENVDPASIRRRELELRHDEKANIEEFNALAGYEFAHLGLTSRDLSDNVEQMEIMHAMMLMRDRSVATLARLGRLAVENSQTVFTQRTHNAPAQPDLVGRVFSNAGETLLTGFNRLEQLIETYPLRGIKGATGTQTDQLQLLGDPAKVDQLEQKVAQFLGFKNVLGSVGQVYPRALDYDFTSSLYGLTAGLGDMSTTLRLMAGNDEFTEGFKPGQVGSTAMPHKMNSRTLERIHALRATQAGYNIMTQMTAGDQWFAGDVSDSATRRVAIPGMVFATDGIFQSALTVLDECGFYLAVIQQELDKYLPFLTTTRLLMAAVNAGIPRETAHSVIKKHSVAAALKMREQGDTENNLVGMLANDPRINLPKATFEAALASPLEFVGNAPRQIANFANQVAEVVAKYPEAATYNPELIL